MGSAGPTTAVGGSDRGVGQTPQPVGCEARPRVEERCHCGEDAVGGEERQSAGIDQAASAWATAAFAAGVLAALTSAAVCRLAWRKTTWIRRPPKAPIAPAIPI